MHLHRLVGECVPHALLMHLHRLVGACGNTEAATRTLVLDEQHFHTVTVLDNEGLRGTDYGAGTAVSAPVLDALDDLRNRLEGDADLLEVLQSGLEVVTGSRNLDNHDTFFVLADPCPRDVDGQVVLLDEVGDNGLFDQLSRVVKDDVSRAYTCHAFSPFSEVIRMGLKVWPDAIPGRSATFSDRKKLPFSIHSFSIRAISWAMG